MEDSTILYRIKNLIKSKTSISEEIAEFQLLPGAGSSRRYYRIILTNKKTLLACYGTNIEENETFNYFSSIFCKSSINVPEVLSFDKDLYIITDLGYTDVLSAKENLNEKETLELYKRILEDLVQIQFVGGEKIDFSKCFVRHEFDKTAMRWDLYYFKYYYLKISGLEFNDQKLEEDFDKLLDFLDKSSRNYFMYRDFQSRNILLKNNLLGYIDFQGGMKGPLQYDVVSLLYQAKANLSNEMREELLSFYIEILKSRISVDEKKFKEEFQGFVFIRILQTLGAYGFRGYIQHKEHFIQSIPQALKNLKEQALVINKIVPMPYLTNLINELKELQIQ
ncbi:MAG: phosphotransferase [Bacteroidales bacterium]|nr:phosphotransferase [Bacteroidales bacterium]